MKHIILLSAVLMLASCVKDDTNYEFPSQQELDSYSIVIDTTGTYRERMTTFEVTWYQDSIYTFHIPGIRYAYPEHLRYLWLVIDHPYSAVTEGNATTYQPADTICRTRDLYYKCKLSSGMHRIYFQAEDTVLGIRSTLQMQYGNYFAVGTAGSIPSGAYALEINQDGLVDIDAFGTPDALIFGDYHEKNLWTRYNADDPIKGEPVSIYMSQGTGYTALWYYIATTEELRRVSPIALATMDKNEELFYQSPSAIRPQAFANVNGADFMINDGKFYCLYSPNEANRKFPAALPGDYDLFPFLPFGTYSRYYGVDGAIGAFQCVFDQKAQALRPYFSKNAAFSQFAPCTADNKFDYNNLGDSQLKFYGQSGGTGDAILITQEADGNTYLNIVTFFNAVDNGNLCAQRTLLSGMLSEIDQAEHIATSTGSAIYYSVGNRLYSWAYNSGRTFANALATLPADEQITCLSTLPTGGWPTGGRVLYVATWNETTQRGSMYHAYIDNTSGEFAEDANWAPEKGLLLIDDEFGKVFAIDYSTHTSIY